MEINRIKKEKIINNKTKRILKDKNKNLKKINSNKKLGMEIDYFFL